MADPLVGGCAAIRLKLDALVEPYYADIGKAGLVQQWQDWPWSYCKFSVEM